MAQEDSSDNSRKVGSYCIMSKIHGYTLNKSQDIFVSLPTFLSKVEI